MPKRSVSPEAKFLAAIFGDKGERMDFTVKRHFGMGLCDRCDHAHQTRLASGKEFTYCMNLHPPVPVHGRVQECSEFDEQNALPLWEMKRMAWYIDTQDGKVIGFVQPGTAKHKNFYRSGRDEE